MDRRLLAHSCPDLSLSKFSLTSLSAYPKRRVKSTVRANAQDHEHLSATVITSKEAVLSTFHHRGLSHHSLPFQSRQWVHFIGIGGYGLSALAAYALKKGWHVTGSDISCSKKLKNLESAGATVYVGHHESHLWDNLRGLPDYVVLSSAIPDSNVELVMSQKLGLKIHKRGPWLSQTTHTYNLIAVSGSHGKSTTTAMLCMVLKEKDPSISAIVGADVSQFPGGGSVMCGSGSIFILEADEYDNCFLSLTPEIALITNIEWEHVDIFPNEESVKAVFGQFCDRLKPGGTLIYCGDSESATSIAVDYVARRQIQDGKMLTGQVLSYGLAEGNLWRASMIEPNSYGGSDYLATCNGEVMAQVQIRLPGVHNVLNSLAVIATAVVSSCKNMTSDSGVLWKQRKKVAEDASRVLFSFHGVRRRFELVGVVEGCEIYDDYAHHPTEVRASLEAARQKFKGRPIWLVFQPHQYSRLNKFLEDFAAALAGANYVIVTEIFGAREINLWKVSSEDLVKCIQKTSAIHIQSLDDVCLHLVQKLAPFILSGTKDRIAVITMGAGNITSLGPKLLENLSKLQKLHATENLPI